MQPRFQGLFPDSGAGPSQGKGPGNEIVWNGEKFSKIKKHKTQEEAK